MLHSPNKFVFWCDPGHAWLAVPAELVEPHRATVSRYSYFRNGVYYLEEDCDVSRWLLAVGIPQSDWRDWFAQNVIVRNVDLRSDLPFKYGVDRVELGDGGRDYA